MIRVVDNVLPLLVARMADEITARSNTPSYGSKNVGGWKSREDLFAWKEATAIAELRYELVTKHLDGIMDGTRQLVGWAMINKNGSYHQRHHHGGKIVGIYYVAAGETAAPTVFELEDPKEQTGRGTVGVVGHSVKCERAIDAVPGRLVVFSPSIWHRVPKCNHEDPRITIAFEVRP
jgi:Putative 2OG-Fe(II) oxygenase